MAERVYRTLTSDEREKVRRDRERLAEERSEIVEKGRCVFERRARLIDALQALRDERKAQGVSLTELEQRTGIHKSALWRLEHDANPNPTVSTLMRIAEALGRQITIHLGAPTETV